MKLNEFFGVISNLLQAETIFEVRFERSEEEIRLNLFVVQNGLRLENDQRHVLGEFGEHRDRIEHGQLVHGEERLV